MGRGGVRKELHDKTIPANVKYFYNRYQTNGIDASNPAHNLVPLDNPVAIEAWGKGLTGDAKIKIADAKATVSDQKETNRRHHANGKPDTRKNWLGQVYTMKAWHTTLPEDEMVQAEIIMIIKAQLAKP